MNPRKLKGQPTAPEPDSAFWNCRLSRWESLLLLVALGVSVVVHLTPVLQSGRAKPLLIGLASVCFLSPTSGFFFIGASAALPSQTPEAYTLGREMSTARETLPAEMTDVSTKYGFVVWVVVTAVWYRRFSLRGLAALWPLAPFLLWLMLIGGVSSVMDEEYWKAVLFSIMACQLANESKGQYLKCLLGLCLGTLVVMVGFWGQRLGLPIDLSTWGGDRGGMARIGSVRADAVMVWPAILIGVGGLAGLGLLVSSKRNRLRPPGWLLPLVVVLSVAAVPPLVATLTQSGYAGAGLLSLVVLLASFSMAVQGGFKQGAMERVVVVALLVVGLLGGLWAMNAFDLRARVEAMSSYREDTTETMGVATTRTSVWTESLAIMLKYPLFGLAGASQTSGISDAPSQLSHNVFLDYGRGYGIPCMLLLAGFFFWPVARLWAARQWIDFLPFLLVHFSLLIFWSCLSFIFYKVFWAFWMLMTLAVERHAFRAGEVARAPAPLRTSRRPTRAGRVGEPRQQ